jgi:hypothetical protein
MNTVQNGKGDTPRNNWGPRWYSGYDAVDWGREQERVPVSSFERNQPQEGRQHPAPPPEADALCVAK